MIQQLHTKSTGNYRVSLCTDDGAYLLRVMYTGDWSGGSTVDLYIDDEELDEVGEEQALEVYADCVGDFDVEQKMAEGGFDTYGNVL